MKFWIPIILDERKSSVNLLMGKQWSITLFLLTGRVRSCWKKGKPIYDDELSYPISQTLIILECNWSFTQMFCFSSGCRRYPRNRWVRWTEGRNHMKQIFDFWQFQVADDSFWSKALVVTFFLCDYFFFFLLSSLQGKIGRIGAPGCKGDPGNRVWHWTDIIIIRTSIIKCQTPF